MQFISGKYFGYFYPVGRDKLLSFVKIHYFIYFKPPLEPILHAQIPLANNVIFTLIYLNNTLPIKFKKAPSSMKEF